MRNTVSGITLIALVITIIVIIILAGITISVIAGNGGILNKVVSAKARTEESSVLEQIKLAIFSSMETNRELNYNKLQEELEKNGISVNDNGNGYVITKDNILQVINKTGEKVSINESTKLSENGRIKLSDNTEVLKNLIIYGNSIQDGTPTDDDPVEIKSVGDLITDENDSNYGKYKIDVVISRKNLLNVNAIADAYNFKDGRVTNNGDGTITLYGKYNLPGSGQKIKDIAPRLKIDRTYYYTWKNKNKLAVNQIYVGDWLGNRFKLTETIYNSVYRFYMNYNAEPRTDVIYDLQIEEGSVATEYEPYVEPIVMKIYLNEPLRKIGDCVDYIDFENKKIVRNVEVIDNTGVKTLDQSLRGLNKPIEETITLPTISVKAGVSIIEVETETLPSNIEADCYVKE